MSTSKGSDPTSEKKSYHHGDLRQALLREARKRLASQGARALSLRGVARGAGVSQSAPYRHFDGKEGLLAALAGEGFRELERVSREAADACSDPLQALFDVAKGYVHFALANAELYPLMFGSVRERRDPDVATAGDTSFRVVVDTVRDCQAAGRLRAGDPLPIAFTVTSLCHGIASFWLDGRAPDALSAEAFTQLALGQLVEGVGNGATRG